MFSRFSERLLVLILVVILSLLIKQTNLYNRVFSPFHSDNSSYDFYDLYYKHFSDIGKQSRSDIAIVNINKLKRLDLLAMLDTIETEVTNGVGIDVFFDFEKDTSGLAKFLHIAESKLNMKLGFVAKNKGDLPIGYEQLTNQSLAHVYLSSQDGFTVRSFNSWKLFSDTRVFALGVALAEMKSADSIYNTQQRRFIDFSISGTCRPAECFQKSGSIMLINPLEDNLNLNTYLKGKWVLFGNVDQGTEITTTDRFFTPLNENVLGRSLPDMNGVVIHANILKNQLEDKYVTEMCKLVELPLTLLILFFVLSFLLKRKKLDLTFDFLGKLWMVLLIVIISVLYLLVFHFFRVRFGMELLLMGLVLAEPTVELYQYFKKKLYGN